ncbi:hypothetical protein OE88DRAFT_1804284 [Heliocybe sulcata]|uniref:Uncharacterized protein n=1 Tax=Heliocybe sulcata TaxID=5364 RepID=A0A5C3NEV4_9AGAM|nr:hypothetical protein OE88DRAFT_1804284 [Heliocybe sulcata]
MAGHRRHNGIVVCPSDGTADDIAMEEDDDLRTGDAPPSPPPSPPPPRPVRQPSEFSIPEDRPWHRKNPNWVDPPPPKRPRPLQAEPTLPQIILPSSSAAAYREASYVSTVLGSVPPPGPDKNDDDPVELPPDPEPATRETLVFASKMPLASVFSVTDRDVNTAQRTARNLGLHTGFIPKPAQAEAHSQRRAKALAAQKSWWMVVGKNDAAVQHLLDAHQKELPGRLDEQPDYQEKQGLSFLQLLIAGAVGGLIVVYCLSFV